MRSALAWLVLSAVAGCTRGAGEARVRPEPSATATVTATATASAAAVVPEPPPLPLPAPPSGTDPERALLAASICAAAYVGKDVGCRSHPPFVRADQKPDGKIIEHKGDPLLFCAIDGVFHGSFTRAGAKQAVVSFTQCKESEDASWDMGFPGSAVLVEEIAGRWKAVGYEPDVNLNFCLQNRRAGGRDVLLCRSNLMAPPAGDVRYVFLLDFARGVTGKRNAGSLVKLFGDAPVCLMADEGLPSGFASLTVTGMSLSDLNKDGTPDLIVKVKRARVPPSPALDAKMRALCKRDPAMPVASAFVAAGKETSLELLSDGERFTPSPATKKVIDAWTAEAPEGFNGLSAVGPPPLD